MCSSACASNTRSAVRSATALPSSDIAACENITRTAAAASSSSATAGAGTGARGTEAVVEAFLARTQSLHSAFALEAAQRLKEPITDSVASVREEVAALQRELDEKEALLAAHRENVVRWKAEMHGVTEACAQVEKPSSSSSSGRST